MARHGEKKHIKRIAVSKRIPVFDRKAYTWITKPRPGAHPIRDAMALGVFIRDVVHFANNMRDVKRMLVNGSVLVNGKRVRDPKYAVGLMDVISFPKDNKIYRIIVDKHNRLVPIETKHENLIYGYVVRKYTLPKGKIGVMLHNGMNFSGASGISIGDTVVYSPGNKKIEKVIKLDKGAVCFVVDGYHAGEISELEEITILGKNIEKQARLKRLSDSKELITLPRYLMPIDDTLRSEIESLGKDMSKES